MTDKRTTHLYCLMQNRLGALDRVLAALTHRGLLPQRMVSTLRPDHGLEILVSFHASDEKMVDKLLKFLQKQVYTLEARTLETHQLEADDASPITPVLNDYAQRRLAHAHNG